MLQQALAASELDGRTWLASSIVHGRPGAQAGGWSPDLNEANETTRRADGWAAFSYSIGTDRQLRDNGPAGVDESRLLDLEIHEDGSVHLFCARATDTRQEGRSLFLPLVAGFIGRVIRSAEVVTELTAYRGPWGLGVAIDKLQGASPWTGREFAGRVPTYTNRDFRRTFEVAAGTLGQAGVEQHAAEALVGPLCRALSVPTPTIADLLGP
jgi:hypothetical protein